MFKTGKDSEKKNKKNPRVFTESAITGDSE